MITIESKQSLYALGVDSTDTDIYSFYKLDLNVKTDEFKVKCLIDNVDLNKEKLLIGVNYNVCLKNYYLRDYLKLI